MKYFVKKFGAKSYVAPVAEAMQVTPLRLLATLSVEGDLEDWSVDAPVTGEAVDRI